MQEILQGSEKTFGYVKSRVGVSEPGYQKLLRTDWNGEETGTLARVEHSQQEVGTNHILIDVVGTQRFRILERERALAGFWRGTIELLAEAQQPVESEKSLAIEAKKLVEQCRQRSERFRSSILSFDS